MRTAAQIALAYFTVLVLGALWRLLPLPRAMPDAVALFAVYLGLTARDRLAPSVAAAVIIGYLGDLLIGSPRGTLALTAGLMCSFAHLLHRRLLVRGMLYTMVFCAITGAASSLILLALRAYMGAVHAAWEHELALLAANAALTAVAGPVVFKMCRAVDARFARTARDRLAALEGLP